MKILCFLKIRWKPTLFMAWALRLIHGHHPLPDLQTMEAFIYVFLVYVCIYICFTYVCIFYTIK